MLYPTSTNERYSILDTLRGFALLGVILANMATHSGYFFISELQKQSMGVSTADEIVVWIMGFLVDGKFYSLFSLLFGVGFAIQMKKSEELNTKFVTRYSKRLTILFFIGLAHAIFFYIGDILTVYALLGFVLFLFRKSSEKSLLTWAVILVILPVLQYLIFWVPAVLYPPEPVSLTSVRPPLFDEIIKTYQTGSFGEIIQMNIGGLVFGRYPDLFFTGRFFKVLAMFLMGVYVSRRMLYINLETRRAFLKRVFFIGLLVGVPCNFVLANMMETDAYYGMQPSGIIQAIVYALGVPSLSLAYAAGIALLFISNKRDLLYIFTPVGRMALTNYLSQSVMACAIFMSYGYSLYAQLKPIQSITIGFAIYLFQMVFSYFWLQYFQFGPAEWLWRCLTYNRWLPIKKSALLRVE